MESPRNKDYVVTRDFRAGAGRCSSAGGEGHGQLSGIGPEPLHRKLSDTRPMAKYFNLHYWVSVWMERDFRRKCSEFGDAPRT